MSVSGGKFDFAIHIGIIRLTKVVKKEKNA
jgi:hypothetical protein